MVAAEVASHQPSADRATKRRPFTTWMKRLATRKSTDANPTKKTGLLGTRYRKVNNTVKNNPYPVSGYAARPSARSSEDGALSFATSNPHPATENDSIRSEALAERDSNGAGKRSAAPTVNTKAETLHSDAGNSKATTTTTGGRAVSSIDGAGAGSTFSSPTQSLRSLTTTLTTIQSTSASNALSPTVPPGAHNPVLFSHQYPVSPASSSYTASAIPRHVSGAHGGAGNTLTDDASIITLASSSKRRRRSMDTDASVRALAPSSVWGGSRESLPLSVLSTSVDPTASVRPSIGGHINTERASIYSNQGVTPSIIAPDRSSYYASAQRKDLTGDAKSLRSINNLDARSQYDAKSINDGKSMDVGSLRGYEGSLRGVALGHNRQDSIPGSIHAARHLQNGGMSRRSSDWAGHDADKEEEEHTEHHEGEKALQT